MPFPERAPPEPPVQEYYCCLSAGKGNAGSEETTEPHILSLLKKFPAYPSLYIDTHGGTYAPDTAAAIRGKAVLYRNPFYNELKKKS